MAEHSRLGWIVTRRPDPGLDPRIHQLCLNLMIAGSSPRVLAIDGNQLLAFPVRTAYSDSGVLDLTPALLRRGRSNRCLLRNVARQAHGEHRALARLACDRDV